MLAWLRPPPSFIRCAAPTEGRKPLVKFSGSNVWPCPRLPSLQPPPGQSRNLDWQGSPYLVRLQAGPACSPAHRAGNYLRSRTSHTSTQWAGQSVTTAAVTTERGRWAWGGPSGALFTVSNRYLLDLDGTVGSPSPVLMNLETTRQDPGDKPKADFCSVPSTPATHSHFEGLFLSPQNEGSTLGITRRR